MLLWLHDRLNMEAVIQTRHQKLKQVSPCGKAVRMNNKKIFYVRGLFHRFVMLTVTRKLVVSDPEHHWRRGHALFIITT